MAKIKTIIKNVYSWEKINPLKNKLYMGKNKPIRNVYNWEKINPLKKYEWEKINPL